MKKIIFNIFTIVAFNSAMFAQFQNWDFETGGNNGIYDTISNWSTSNPMTYPVGQISFMINNAAYSGLQAASMNTSNLGVSGLAYPGAIVNGNYGFSSLSGYDDYIKGGEELNLLGGSKISAISGYWLYSTISPNDSAVAKVLLKAWNSSTNQSDTVALGELKTASISGGYAPFKVNLNYLTTKTPDSIVVAFFSTDPDASFAGGKLKVDNLSPNYTTNIKKDSKLLIETYPNPCEDYIWLKQSTSQSYQWRLFDIVGNVVKQGRSQLVDERLDMIGLSSGLYVLKVQNSQGAFIKQIQKN